MKQLIISLFFTITSTIIFCQTWSVEQLKLANTAKYISYLNTAEKEAIQYINLARLYPKLFATIELESYVEPIKYGNALKNSSYKKTLLVQLASMAPMAALTFNKELYDNAKCFATESGDLGLVGHERKLCAKGNYAECCSYGMATGKDVAMQWLIDDKIANLGHRINCLNSEYAKIGLSMHSHKVYEVCAVAEMAW